jgi:hypothetical protein
MKKSADWFGRRVRLKADVNGRVGVVIGKGKFRTWWLVEWPDGSKKLYPERLLEIVAE